MNLPIIVWYLTVNIFLLGNLIITSLSRSQDVVKFYSVLSYLVFSVLAVMLAVISNNLLLWIGFMLTLTAALNSARTVSMRYRQKQTLVQSHDTALGLLALTQLVMFGWLAVEISDSFSVRSIVDLLSYISLTISILIFAKMVEAIVSSRFALSKNSPITMPTVTLAIPARNETHALAESMRHTIKSRYKKLEILVLDDCSQDDTAQIIKAFAHDGVRFVQGKESSDGWLGKNHAYKTLLGESSGEYIIFAGVDVRFNEKSITQLVQYVSENNLDMLSILPIRNHFDFGSTLIQPLRYFWQIATPFKKNPPVLSTCWMIKKEALSKLGGFDAYKSAIIPETYFARDLKDKYRFVFSNKKLGISTRKKWSSQLETATRTIYPMLHRDMFRVLMSTLGLLILFIFPFAALVSLIWLTGDDAIKIWAISAIILLSSYLMLSVAIFRKSWWISVISMPIGIFLDSVLLIWSMWQYEFGSVNWKGRNICYPIMRNK